nr:unnamed protein product [Digitaria exilis]
MAPSNFSLAAVLLLSGTTAEACNLMCALGTYITCSNSTDKYFGCACQCVPPGCSGAVVHYADNSTQRC